MLARLFCLGVLLFATPAFADGDGERAVLARLVGEIDQLAPLLKEAEPWADQATMRFYPDVWAAEGASTPIPNLSVAITLSRSWVARAASNPDSPMAIEDCRRAIRWGRLLRQDDTTIVQDLVGLASIRMGADQLYALAARRGDQALMLAAAIVQGEAAPQRLRTAGFITRILTDGKYKDFTSSNVDAAIQAAKTSPDRRFRNEAIVMLGVTRFKGASAQWKRAEKTLEELKGSSDAFIAGNARWALGLRRGDLAQFTAPGP